MRILHVIQCIPRGGAPIIVETLARRQARRHTVGVVCSPDSYLAETLSLDGVLVIPLPMTRSVNLWRDATHVWELSKVIERFSPDVLHVHSSKAGVLGRFAAVRGRTPVVYSPHNFAFRAFEGGWVPRQIFMRIERLLAPLTTILHCTCEDERREAIQRNLSPRRRAVVAHNAIDLEPFLELDGESDRAEVTIGTYGRLAPQKRIDLLLQAVATMPERESFRTVIVGSGPLRAELDALNAELGDVAQIIGDPGNALAALKMMDVYVLASPSETYPLAVMEAMAAGKAVIATRVGGVPELIEDEVSGLLVDPGDVHQLAHALHRVVTDGRLRKDLQRSARSVALERFSLEELERKIDAIYLEALSISSERKKRRSSRQRTDVA